MNPHATALAFGRALKANEVLAPIAIYAHDREVLADLTDETPAEVILPCVTLRVQFEGLAGSARIGKAKIEITVRSQADDEDSATHSAREKAVRAVMADIEGLTDAFDAGEIVALCGLPSLTNNDPDVEARAYHTPITYVMGVQEIA